ncbi:MAG: ABC transporter permease subunit [Propionibacteriaceae bacterium]|jgi:ABC-2 type transport system permease protein|nr:ABC transporter permease subunit [Propionibacteriaceae bacterium]
MTAIAPLLRLRAQDIFRTWRVWVLPSVMVFLAATGTVITRFTREILVAALGAGQADAILLADPVASDAYARWANDLTQIAVLLVVVIAAGAINSEVRSGVAALILTKPASRVSYVLSHAFTLIAFTALAAHLGAVVSWLVTAAVFGPAPLGPVLAATAVWAVLAAVLISAALLASAAFDAYAGAAGAGIGAFFLLALLSVVPQLAEHTPAGLATVVNAIATGTQKADQTLWQPVLSGLALAGALLAAAVLVFRRRELR